MRLRMSGMIALGALITIGANDIAGQQGQNRNRGEVTMRRGQGVEAIMQMREQLELTEAQLSSLEEIRRETIQRRVATLAEAAEVRSQLSAGQIKRSEMMAFMEDRQEANAGVAEAVRERVSGILTEDQRASLQEIGARRQAFARGQARGNRGGSVGVRGGFRGRPGAGMRPGRGFRGRGDGAAAPGAGFGRDGGQGFRGARRPGAPRIIR